MLLQEKQITDLQIFSGWSVYMEWKVVVMGHFQKAVNETDNRGLADWRGIRTSGD